MAPTTRRTSSSVPSSAKPKSGFKRGRPAHAFKLQALDGQIKALKQDVIVMKRLIDHFHSAPLSKTVNGGFLLLLFFLNVLTSFFNRTLFFPVLKCAGGSSSSCMNSKCKNLEHVTKLFVSGCKGY